MNKYADAVYNGLIRENPTFVLQLGMCPTLAVTTSGINGIGMGLSTTAVLMMSNLLIGCLRNIIPDRVRIPSYIVIIASFVTVVDLVLQAFAPGLYGALGIYIPLIVVNCIIFGRAEAFAGKNPGLISLFDGIGMGLGFTWAITCIGLVREFLGAGTLFGVEVLTRIPGFVPVTIFVMAPGAFFVLAALTALQIKLRIGRGRKGAVCGSLACGGSCDSCGNSVFAGNRAEIEKAKAVKAAAIAEEKAARAAMEKAAKAARGKAAQTDEKGR